MCSVAKHLWFSSRLCKEANESILTVSALYPCLWFWWHSPCVILMFVEGRAHTGKPVIRRAKHNSQQSMFSASEEMCVCVCVCEHVCCRTVWSVGRLEAV